MSIEDKKPNQFETQWHYLPEAPIQVSPFFQWPPEPKKMFRWVVDRWFAVAENSMLVIVALISWFWFQPSMSEAESLHWRWIAEI